MIKRILIYGFPFYLILIESILRKAYRLESEAFIGPTLAAVGVSFLLPLIVPKKRDFPVTQQTKQEVEAHGMTMRYKSEERFIDAVWLFIFTLTACWTYCLYLSSQSQIQLWWTFPIYKIIGFFNYFVGVLFSEIKEVV
jgi:hypothetical protein